MVGVGDVGEQKGRRPRRRQRHAAVLRPDRRRRHLDVYLRGGSAAKVPNVRRGRTHVHDGNKKGISPAGACVGACRCQAVCCSISWIAPCYCAPCQPCGILSISRTSLTTDVFRAATHLSVDVAMMFAMLEYLHVDCRLMHARQWGLVRSHCTWYEFSGYHGVAQRRILPDTALTLVLRSTHSSQLNVGLLRFCFFFVGSSGVALLDTSGLPDVKGFASSSMARLHAQHSCQRGVARSAGRSQAT